MGPVPPADWRTLTVVTGPAGIGRTHALDHIRAAAQDAGLATVGLRLSPLERTLMLHLVSRLAGELSVLSGDGVGDCRKPRDRPTPDGVRRALVHQAAAALARARSARRGLVVLVDDLQWADRQSLAVLAAMVRDLAGSTVSVVCAVRTPVLAEPLAACRALSDELVADGIAAVRPLRPMSGRQADTLVAELLQAKPHRAFSRHLGRLCRGRPGALHVAVESYRRNGSLRVVDHRCGLTDPLRRHEPPELAGVAGVQRLLEPVRELPAPARMVAAAVAVLHPFGGAVPRLLGRELGIDSVQVAAALDALVAAGVLREDRARGGWRFTVPLVAHALRSDLGPYERRRLAQAAVGAAWNCGSRPTDPHHLADELVHARGLVDPERASAELLAHGISAILSDARGAARWLSSAAEGTSDHTRRRYALFGQAVASCLDGDHPAAIRGARLVAREYACQLSSDEQRELQLSYVLGVGGTGDAAELRRIAAGAAPLAGGPAADATARGMALCLLDRWPEAEALLAQAETSASGTVGSECAKLIRCCAAALLGRSAQLLDLVGSPACPCRHHVGALVRTLMLLGDANRAERVLAERGLSVTALPLDDMALLAWRRGRWDDALDYGLASIASGRPVGYPSAAAAVYYAVATILASRGRMSRARALLNAAREAELLLSHLVYAADAHLDWIFGAPAEAERTVSAALADARLSGVTAGTGELWLLRTELLIGRGDREEALRRLPVVAELAGTDHSAALHHQLVRVLAEGNRVAAGEAVSLARTLGQPYLLARTLEIAAGAERRPELLSEAYDLYGELDAVLDRCRVRTLMREQDVAVPDRQATAAENERIVATLVADGLSNREIATGLQTSEKSVEGRLTRLFTRTGYRSRVELATAVLTGDYRPG